MKLIRLVKKYFVVLIVLLIICLVLFLRSLTTPKQTTPIQSPAPQSSIQLQPVKVIPENGKISSAYSVEPVVFVFNIPVDKDSIIYTVNPKTDSKVTQNAATQNEISIIPLTGWEQNTPYTIQILNAVSLSGSTLKSPISTTVTRVVTNQDIPPEVFEDF